MLARFPISAILLVVAAALGPRTGLAEDGGTARNPSEWFLPVVKLASVSNSFAEDFHRAAQTIPQPIWQQVLDAGWRVSLAENVVDVVPGLRGISPRGWPAGLSWDNTDAVHLPNAKLLIVAEKRRNKKGEIVRCTRVGGVLRHEVGHAFDVLSGKPSNFQSARKSFLDAYHADLARMDQQHRTELRYYVQQGTAGHQETFAEAFGILFGGGSDATHRQAFTAAFPQTIESVRRAVSLVRSDQVALSSLD